MVLLSFLSGCRNRNSANPTPDIQVDEQFWIRVLLVDNATEFTLAINSKFSIEERNTKSNMQVALKKYNPFKKPVEVSLKEGHISVSGKVYQYDQLVICPESPNLFSVNNSGFRGKLQITVHPDGSSFDVINLVPLESYIAGVAGAEMPDYWEPEALKCQVIVARTYCLFIKKRFGVNRQWDVSKTAAHQVYRGIESESKAVWDAVNDTCGMVLTCMQSDGNEDIFPTYYSSTCGGSTENSENVFGDSYEPLKGVICEYCINVAKPEVFFWPDAVFEKAEVIEKLISKYPNLARFGENMQINVAQESDYGEFTRLTRIDITDPNGNRDFLRAEDFRLTIDPSGRKIKSATCKLEQKDDKLIFTNGRGWGHSVGMCQCGAEGMAREGKTTGEILAFYYPGSKIYKIDYNGKLQDFN